MTIVEPAFAKQKMRVTMSDDINNINDVIRVDV